MTSWQIVPLDATAHDRSAFSCGKVRLDEFIKTQATQYEKRDMGRTYVALLPPSSRIVGYYTISVSAVAFLDIPAEAAKKLPRHPIPVAHLGRMAVDQSVQGQKLGEYLLLHCLNRCWRLATEIGIHAVEVKALDQDARDFYLKYGFVSLLDDALHLYMPMRKIRTLFEPKTK